jgi:hypothetical protein
MSFKWFGLLGLVAALYVGDQIRLDRPAHKYRLSVVVETPDGNRSASGVLSVHPDRGYSRGGTTQTRGDAVFVDLGGGRNLIALLAQGEHGADAEGMSYLALRVLSAAGGKRLSFNDVARNMGSAPVTGELLPVLVSFADLNDPTSARTVRPDGLEAAFGKGVRLHGVTVEVVPNGFWPVDFGGVLGEPVTRGIQGKLPWWNRPDHQAAAALRAAGLTPPATFAAEAAFTRK